MVAALLAISVVQATLPNGLEVTVLPDPTMPVVATQVWYHVGSANEAPDERGLAHLFEHLMFGGTATSPRGELDRFVTRVGGDENAYTTPDETVYVSEVPPAAASEIVRLEADRMRNLVLTEQGLDNEKRIVTEELRLRTENDPMTRLLIKAQRALLAGHPYAYDPSGTKDDVARATVATCRAFYDAYYHPNNAHVVVVGAVDGEKELSAIRDAFGSIPRGGRSPGEIAALDTRDYPSDLALKEDIPPVEIALIGMPLPPADASDAAATDVLLELLAGGSVDPVHEIVVTHKRKAIEAGIETIGLRRGGGIIFYSASLPYRRRATAMRVLDETIVELDRMSWLTDETLDAAKRRLIEDDAATVVYAARRAGEIGRSQWWLGDAGHAFDRAARIGAVTRQDVAAAWRRHVTDAQHVRIYVKPERVPVLIRMFGWLYPLFS